MNTRATLINESAALISNVKALENQQRQLRDQIEQAKEKLENQKLEALYLNQLIKLDSLPDINTTSNKVNKFRIEINDAKKEQEALREQSKQLQDQIDLTIKVRDQQIKSEMIQNDISQLEKQLESESQKQNDLKIQLSDVSSKLLKVQFRKKAILDKLNSALPEKPDVKNIQKKTEILKEQIKLMSEKHHAFEQELEDAAAHLSEVLDRHTQIQSIIEKISKENPGDKIQNILDLATNNMDLRQYTNIPRGSERDIRDAENLYSICKDSIERANLAFES